MTLQPKVHTLMANYLSAIKRTLQWEGGYSKRTDDPETYRGISRTSHPDWKGWRIVDTKKRKQGEIIPELEYDVIEFYHLHYWLPIRLDEVCNDAVAGFTFDWYVNSGRSGIKSLQRALGLQDDGIVGSKTIHALNQTDLATLKQARIAYLKSLNKPQFERGWLRRINSF